MKLFSPRLEELSSQRGGKEQDPSEQEALGSRRGSQVRGDGRARKAPARDTINLPFEEKIGSFVL